MKKHLFWIGVLGVCVGIVLFMTTRAPKYPEEGLVGPDVSIGTAEMDPELKDLEKRMLQIEIGMEVNKVLKIFEGYPYQLSKSEGNPNEITAIDEYIPKSKLPASPTRFLYFSIRFEDGKVSMKGFNPNFDNGCGRRQKKWSMLSERIC